MKGKDLLLLTVKISLAIQVICGLIGFSGIFIPLQKKDLILRDILIIDTIVQAIEATWYVYIALAMKHIKEETIASRRYSDWVLTTPIMLLATVLFMEYDNIQDENIENENKNTSITTKKVISDNKNQLLRIGIYNYGMLLFGYLGEINILNKFISIPIGTIFFILSFKEIWVNYAKSEKSKKLFYFLAVVWGMYGVGAMQRVIPKNIMYNCLDIVSKNFYGLYIFYEIFKIRKKN